MALVSLPSRFYHLILIAPQFRTLVPPARTNCDYVISEIEILRDEAREARWQTRTSVCDWIEGKETSITAIKGKLFSPGPSCAHQENGPFLSF
jgi:hypothetical protein